MKKFLFFAILFSASYAVSAQWYIGVKAGPTLSNYKSKTPWKEASNIGYTVGATAFRQVNANFGVSFELQYIQKGYYHKICNTIYDKLKANYIEIPIMLDYTFVIPSLKNFKAHANIGIYTAYWVSAKYDLKGFSEPSESFDFGKSNASRFDIGPNVGGRIEYVLKNGSLSLDFRYELGMIDLQKQINDNTKNTNRALVIGVSYMKPIGF